MNLVETLHCAAITDFGKLGCTMICALIKISFLIHIEFTFALHLYLAIWNLLLIYDLCVHYDISCLQATFDCLLKTYGFLTPEFWKETRFSKSPFQEYTDLLAKPTGKTLILEEERVEA